MLDHVIVKDMLKRRNARAILVEKTERNGNKRVLLSKKQRARKFFFSIGLIGGIQTEVERLDLACHMFLLCVF